VDEYIEPGVSALPLDKRPAFREMIDRIIAQRDVKYVIVYMLNRLPVTATRTLSSGSRWNASVSP
jgi:DNA invertase Pin-like site-specific DNA recombinase